MDMGMKGKVLSPGMQDGNHASISMHPGEKKRRQGTPDRLKQQIIHQGVILQKESVESVGDGKHHMEIGHREQIPDSFRYPDLALNILAFRTMTVAAGVIRDADMAAFIAPVFMPTQYHGAATTDRP